MIPVQEDYMHPLADAMTIITNPNDEYRNLDFSEYYKKYMLFRTSTMYYLGKKNLCQKVTIKKHPDLTEKWFEDFYPFVNNIEKAIINNKIEEFPRLEKELWNKFVEKFSFDDMRVLNAVMQNIHNV